MAGSMEISRGSAVVEPLNLCPLTRPEIVEFSAHIPHLPFPKHNKVEVCPALSGFLTSMVNRQCLEILKIILAKQANIVYNTFQTCRCVGIGRRGGLKIHCQRWRAGSSPATGTNYVKRFRCRGLNAYGIKRFPGFRPLIFHGSNNRCQKRSLND